VSLESIGGSAASPKQTARRQRNVGSCSRNRR